MTLSKLNPNIRFKAIELWLLQKWEPGYDYDSLKRAYLVTFSTPEGRLVLNNLVNSVYCTVYTGNDSYLLGNHNGRRTLVHEILEFIEAAEKNRSRDIEVESLDAIGSPHGENNGR